MGAVPPELTDPTQEQLVMQAADIGMRQAFRISGVAGLILLSVVVAMGGMCCTPDPSERTDSPKPCPLPGAFIRRSRPSGSPIPPCRTGSAN